MNITMTGINYQINEQGETTGISATYQQYENQDAFNATVTLLPEDAKEPLDELTRSKISELAKEKIVGWIKRTTK